MTMCSRIEVQKQSKNATNTFFYSKIIGYDETSDLNINDAFCFDNE